MQFGLLFFVASAASTAAVATSGEERKGEEQN